MPTPEGIVKNTICRYLATRKDVVAKFWINSSTGIYDPKIKKFRRANSPYQINGVSDILGILKDGKLLAIEVKAKKTRASFEQQIFIEDVNKNGGIAFVAWSMGQVKSILDAILAGNDPHRLLNENCHPIE